MNLSEVAEECMLLCGFLEEAYFGPMSAAMNAKRFEHAEFKAQIYLFSDAKSVLVAMSNPDVRTQRSPSSFMTSRQCKTTM